MPYAPRIVLHLPISDPILLEPFVRACLRDKVSLIAIVGDGCEKVEDLIDWFVVGDGSAAGRFLATTAHPVESIEDVLQSATSWKIDERPGIQLVRL